MFVADTNVYVSADREPAFALRFETFLRTHGPIPLSSVVVAELLLGLPAPTHAAAIAALVAGQFTLPPNLEDWTGAAAAVVQLGAAAGKSRSFWNDALLAAQCSRLGWILVTQNPEDFRRLQRVLRFDFIAPFPA